MPHCVVEYAESMQAQFNMQQIIHEIHHGVIASGLFEAAAVKTRGYAAPHAFVGHLEEGHFIHIQLTIMPGRSSEQKQHLMHTVYQAIAEYTQQVDSVTMMVSDIDKPHYFKVLKC
ncbi:5-carboxymethyl-2-hydroxymuconate isomerase [Shewanella sp. Scap07]|uniref:5-carboxymethyl-2-hydroxymuconate Delta-isomerase n=1 Tax=Shewanella sp. Scap07 TaxID=2589987 RepID=UPI0015BC20AB|nr:5-carboxymethyl-2-hydroxymuconate isomerase [Shewanella sp. Scap07]QLE85172.1 5-carboxymethyl-2-hydroxymuconate isomerase [Shewanella sp. Scap07]